MSLNTTVPTNIDDTYTVPSLPVENISNKEDRANKGIANGYAPLDANSKVPSANLPVVDVSGQIATHNSATTSVHGIANTAELIHSTVIGPNTDKVVTFNQSGDNGSEIVVSGITNAGDGYIAGIMGWGNVSGTQWSDLNGTYIKTSVAVTPSAWYNNGMHTPASGTFNYYLQNPISMGSANSAWNGIAYFLAPNNRSGWGDPNNNNLTDPPVNYWRLVVGCDWPYTYFTNPSTNPSVFPTTGWVPVSASAPTPNEGLGYQGSDYLPNYGGGFSVSVGGGTNSEIGAWGFGVSGNNADAYIEPTGLTVEGSGKSVVVGPDKIQLDNGAKLRKGTTDAQDGGYKGIALECSAQYELKWEAGRLYTMQQNGTTIRSVEHCMSAPTANDDETKGYAVGTRWVMDSGKTYVCTDATEEEADWELVFSQEASNGNSGGSVNTSGGGEGSGGSINTSCGLGGAGGSINTSNAGGSINTSNNGGSVDLSFYGGSINSHGPSIEFMGGSITLNSTDSASPYRHSGSIDLSAGTYGDGGSITSTGGYDDIGGNIAGGSLNMSGGSNGAGGSINTSNGGGNINTSNGGGYINTSGDGSNSGGSINTNCGVGGYNGGSINMQGGGDGSGGSINTSNGGGSINTSNGGGSIDLSQDGAGNINMRGASSGAGGSIGLAGSINTSANDDNANGGSINTSGGLTEGTDGGSINTSGGVNGAGGSINTSNGGGSLILSGGEYGLSGGTINLSGGSGFAENLGGRGGSITAKGCDTASPYGNTAGHGGSINLNATEGNGGSIISTGGGDPSYHGGTLNMSGGGDRGGGSIDTTNGGNIITSNGGNINTSNGGGSIDTSSLDNQASSTLLLHFESFVDSSGNNYTITPSGASILTTQKRFGNSSGYFNGGSYITTTLSEYNWSNYTVEMWVYRSGFSGTYNTLFESGDIASGRGGPHLYCLSNGSIVFNNGVSGGITTSASMLPTGVWTHIAVTGHAGINRLFVNGVLAGTATQNITAQNAITRFGGSPNYSQYFTGYIDEARIIKGFCSYTSNFTPFNRAFVGSGIYYGGSINTSGGGGSINTSGNGIIELGDDGVRTTLKGSAVSNQTITLPNATGTIALTSHTHGNLTSDGKIGSTANLPLITTTSGVVTTGTFGTTANSFCQGNDVRLGAQTIFTLGGDGNTTAITNGLQNNVSYIYGCILTRPLRASGSYDLVGLRVVGNWTITGLAIHQHLPNSCVATLSYKVVKITNSTTTTDITSSLTVAGNNNLTSNSVSGLSNNISNGDIIGLMLTTGSSGSLPSGTMSVSAHLYCVPR